MDGSNLSSPHGLSIVVLKTLSRYRVIVRSFINYWLCLCHSSSCARAVSVTELTAAICYNTGQSHRWQHAMKRDNIVLWSKKKQFFHTPPAFDDPVTALLDACRNIAIRVWCGKTRMVCGYPTVRKVWGYDNSFCQNTRTWQTDRRTDAAWCRASRTIKRTIVSCTIDISATVKAAKIGRLSRRELKS